MGYAPFWPTSLATVNILVVPACPISSQRFDEVYNALRNVKSVDLRDVDLENAKSDLIFSSKPVNGSVLFNYSKTLHHSSVQRLPFEFNAAPQIVFGIYEPANGGHDEITQEDEARSNVIQNALSRLRSTFDQSSNGCTSLVLALGSADIEILESVIPLAIIDEEAAYTSLTKATARFVSNCISLIERLADTRLEDPRPVLELTNGGTPRGSHETGRTSLQEHPNSQSPEPLQTTIQTTDRQKGRYIIVLGLLNLLVGSWSDALRRLSEGAASASESGDRLWHARAVEGLLVCMTLQAWQGVEFNVPEVFDPSKAYAASHSSQRVRSASISARITAIAQRADVVKLKPGERWFQLAPFVANLTMDLYSSSQGRELPQILIAEARVRLINTLIFCQISRDAEQSFDRFVMDRQHTPSQLSSSMVRGSDTSLANLLIDVTSTLEGSSEASDTVELLSATISGLAALGANRKHTFLLRSLMLKLAPAMIKARRLGASEAGIHPTAALAATSGSSAADEGEAAGGICDLLIAALKGSGVSIEHLAQIDPVETSARLPEDLQRWVDQHITGDLSLKLEIFQACISVCDAVPDMQASLTFTSELLRLAIRKLTISPLLENSRPWLTPENQVYYTDHIKKATAAAEKLGLITVKAPYWDNFLVRDVHIYQLPNASHLTSHQPSELSLVHNSTIRASRDPFIFNPFAKTTTKDITPIVVAGELITFSVLLQNPLEVEIDANEISLVTEGCDFEPTRHSMVLGAFCAQLFTLTGIASKSGSMKVTGCRAIINGCHEQVFPIYRDDWQPSTQVKQKSKGPSQPSNEEGEPPSTLTIPQESTYSLRVIDPQPQIKLETTALDQASLMLLEGERRFIELSISNTSLSTPADLVLFTYQDNVSSSLQETLGRKDLSPADTYEVQHQLKYKPSIQMSSSEDLSELPPQQTIKRRFQISGTPGLLTSAVQVNFAYLGKPRSDVQETFYTRRTMFPIAVTVNGSIEIVRCNILPIGDDFAFEPSRISNRTKPAALKDGYCMLSLDLRNVWPQPLSVSMTSDFEDSGSEGGYSFEQTVQPGHISRAILLVPRIFVQDVYAPIPSLVTQRQFVVSASKLSLEAESASRETFWYREALIKRLNGRWKEEGTGRQGEIDLRKGIRVTPRMIDVLKVDHVDISFEVRPDVKATTDTADSVKKIGRSHFSVPVESFSTLHVRVHNRSQEKLALLLRLQPSLKDQPHNIALDLSRRFAWSGVLQQALHPPLNPGDIRETKLGLVPFVAGRYELNATVEEIKGRRGTAAPSVDGILGNGPERKIWHARMGCLIDAVDQDL